MYVFGVDLLDLWLESLLVITQYGVLVDSVVLVIEYEIVLL